MLKKIVAIGPESTGKSTLCEQLASYYDTLWCPEFARKYLSVHGMKYDYEDLLTIAKGQVALEEKHISMATFNASFTNRRLLFIDTNMYVMKVWCEFVFGKCHPFITEEIGKRKYDLYLLCNIDLPWSYDELREYPDIKRRQELYSIYKSLLENQAVPWVEISGDSDERLRKAVESITALTTE